MANEKQESGFLAKAAAFLRGDEIPTTEGAVAPKKPEDTDVPTPGAAEATAPPSALVQALTEAGISTPEQLKATVELAGYGQQYVERLRLNATNLAVVVFRDQPQDLAAAKEFIAAADPALVRATGIQYAKLAEQLGYLNADGSEKARQSAASFTERVEATEAQPDASAVRVEDGKPDQTERVENTKLELVELNIYS